MGCLSNIILGRLIAGTFGSGVFLIALSFVDCTQTALAVVLLVLAVTTSGFVFSGYYVNHMDIAPQYAGMLMGLSNGIAAITGFVAPYIAFALTESVSKFERLMSNSSNGHRPTNTVECDSYKGQLTIYNNPTVSTKP